MSLSNKVCGIKLCLSEAENQENKYIGWIKNKLGVYVQENETKRNFQIKKKNSDMFFPWRHLNSLGFSW